MSSNAPAADASASAAGTASGQPADKQPRKHSKQPKATKTKLVASKTHHERVAEASAAAEGVDVKRGGRFSITHIISRDSRSQTAPSKPEGINAPLSARGQRQLSGTPLSPRSKMPEVASDLDQAKHALWAVVSARDADGLPAAVDKLKSLNGDVNFKQELDGFGLLHKCALVGGCSKLLATLVEGGAQVDITDESGRTPLMLACERGDVGAAQTLVLAGASVSHKDTNGRTALHSAAENGQRECVELLLAHKARVNGRDANGWTPLHLAAQRGRYSCTKALLKHGADTEMRNKDNSRAVDLVETQPHVSGDGKWIIELLRRDWSKHATQASETDNESEVSEAPDSLPAPLVPAPPAVTAKKQLPIDRFGFVVSDQNEVQFCFEGQDKEAHRAKKWSRMLKEWDAFERKHRSKIRSRCDKGVPNMVRGQVWRKLTNLDGLRASKKPYTNFLGGKGDETTIDQIAKDLNRTLPTHFLFAEDGGKGQKMLGNVLNAFANYDPAVGYCQGMGFITAMALMYMSEEDAFWFLVRIAGDYRLGGLWMPGLPMLGQTMFVVQGLIGAYFPKLLQHLDNVSVPPPMYAPQYFITGYLYNLPFHLVLRVWDAFLVRGFEFLYAVLLSLFRIYEERMLKMEFEELMTFLRFHNTENKENLLTFDTNLVIKTAAAFKITQQVKELEEEYAAQNAHDPKRTASFKSVISTDNDAEDSSHDDMGGFIGKDEPEASNKKGSLKKKDDKKAAKKK